jgi:hypothetical protein
VLLILALLAWQESQKPYRFRPGRVLAQVLAVLAIGGLLLRPSREVREEKPGLIVLTTGYSEKVLDSLTRLDKGLKVVRMMDGNSGSEEVTDSLTSYRQLEREGVVRYVLGSGIPVPYLETLRRDFQFLPGPPPNGIVALDIPSYPEHRRNWLTGKARGSKGTSLVLRGPGGVEDSLVINTDALSSFQLRFTSKVAGQYVYNLTIRDKGGRTTVEEVPVEVVGGRSLTVLLLQAYPTAEVRFLKNYLTAKGHRLVTRYQVSKNIYRYEVANGAVQPTGVLDTKKLGDFDLVIADNESLQRSSPEELRAMDQAVRDGLGVLELLNDLPDARTFPGAVLRLSPVSEAPDTIRHAVGSFGSFTLPFVAVKAGRNVQAIANNSGLLLQGLLLYGEGKISVQSLRETYRLALGGDHSAYAALWTPLLEQSARREEESVKLRVTTPFPVYPDEPVDVEMVGPGPAGLSTASGALIPLAEDLQTDDLWRGSAWFSDAGWNTLTGKGLTSSLFISRRGAWPAVRAEVQRHANALREGRPEGSTPSTRREDVPPILFFLIFVLSSGFVWLAPKL